MSDERFNSIRDWLEKWNKRSDFYTHAELVEFARLRGPSADDIAWLLERVEELEAALADAYRCFDGRFRYVCEQGHHIVANEPSLDVCSAEVTTGGAPALTLPGVACGAEIAYREVDVLAPVDASEGGTHD